jgi:predicted dehydrogenase
MLKDPATFGEYQLTYRTGDITSLHVDAAEPLGVEMQDFCNAIRLGTVPVSSAEIGLEVVRMIEAVDRSLDHDGTRIALEGEPAELPLAIAAPAAASRRLKPGRSAGRRPDSSGAGSRR